MKHLFRILALLCLGAVPAFSQAAPPYAFATGSMTGARVFHTSTVLQDGSVLVTGGSDGTHIVATAETYNSATGAFTATVGAMSDGRSEHTATLLPNGLVLIVGGYDGSTALNTAELFDPSTSTFTVTGSMTNARYIHTATLLNNGKVLIAGGIDNSGLPVAQAEIYDPSTGLFSPAATMSTARSYHTAVLLQDGRILIIGGLDNSNLALKSAEIYDPTQNSFAPTGSMSDARYSNTATLLTNGKVLVAGGFNDTVTLGTAELYDPSRGTFTVTGSMSAPRGTFGASLLGDGRVLIIGGANSSGFLNSVEAYEPLTGTFSLTGSLLTTRARHRTTLLQDGRILIAGGKLNSSTFLSTAEIFTPFTSTSGSMSSARTYATGTVLNNGQVLVAGGQISSAATNTADLYNPATQTFTATSGTMNIARTVHAAVLLNDGRVLLVGGSDGSAACYNSAELYDPATGTFTPSAGTMTDERCLPTATLLKDGRVLIAGGYSPQVGYLNSTEIYDPATDSFTPCASMAEARIGQTATLLPDGRVLITGGQNGPASKTAEIYDPVAGSFSYTGSMSVARTSHTAVLLNNGKVLVAGYDNTAELFDPFAGTFSPTTNNMSAARQNHSASLLQDGRVLIAGGYYGDGQVTSSADLYDATTNTFAPIGALSSPRYGHVARLLNNGQVLIAGGTNGSTDSNTAELYTAANLVPPGLASIALAPSSGKGAIGYGVPMTATGTFSDSHTELLQSLTWSSSNPAVASATNDDSNRGRTYGLATGTSTITACAGSVCGSTGITVVSGASDLAMTSSVSPQSFPSGQSQDITYTLQVANNGPNPSGAANVVVTDTLPSGVTLVSITTTVGSCAGTTCNLGLMAPAATATISVVVNAPSQSGRSYPNSASIDSADYDPHPESNLTTATAYSSDCIGSAPSGYNAVWIGGASSDWNNPLNWSTGVAPSTVDNVFVCSTAPHQPSMLLGIGNTHDLMIGTGATLDLANGFLYSYGSVTALGPVISSGSESALAMAGTGLLQGSVTNLYIWGTVTLSGDTAASGIVALGNGDSFSSLTLNGYTATVNGQFAELPNSTLVMQNSSDHLYVNGDAIFSGGNNATSLTAGLFEVTGNLYIGCCDPNVFSASGTHLTRMIGPANASRALAMYNSSSTGNHFQNLEFAVSSGSLQVSCCAVYVNGDLSITGPGIIDPAQSSSFYLLGALTTASGTSFNPNYVEAHGPVSIGGYFAPYEIDFVGAGQTLVGTVDAYYTYIYGDLTLQGDAEIGGTSDVYVYGSLNPNGHSAYVSGQYFYVGNGTYPNAAVYMQQDADRLILDVDYAYFQGTSYDSQSNPTMTAGVLDVYGDLYGDLTSTGFVPTGTHLTRLVGTGGGSSGYQYVDVLDNGDGYYNQFQNLEIGNTSAAGIEFGDAVPVVGTFTKKAGQLSTIYGYYFTVPVNAGSVDVDGLADGSFSGNGGMPLVANGVQNLNNVIFQGFLSSDIQLTVNDPGATTPYTFTGLSFLTDPCTDCGGYYIFANDTNPSDGNVLTINMVDAVPADGSSATTTAGGAVVNWSQTGSQRADRGVTMTAYPDAVLPSSSLSYTIVVTNHGPASAESVTLTDTIPSGATFSQITTTIGSCDTSGLPAITCSFGNMASGTSAYVYLYLASPSAAGIAVNQASLNASSTDTNPGNDSASVSTPVTSVIDDLGFVSMSAPPTVQPGTTFVYDMQLNEYSGTGATGVVITQTLPAGFTFVSASGATCSGTPLVCNVGAVPFGAPVDVRVTVQAGSSGATTSSIATVTSIEADSNLSNNQASAQVVVTGLPLGVVERESLTTDGSEIGSAYSYRASPSYTGRFVTFDSTSAYVSDDSNALSDVFLRDNCRGATGCTPSTIRVSVSQDPQNPNANGESYRSAVSSSGRYVAFYSEASNLTADELPQTANIFIRDTCIGTAPGTCTPSTALVSAASDGTPGNDTSGNYGPPAISSSGRYVVFDSYSSNLTPQYNDYYGQVFLRDTCMGASSGCTPSTILVSATVIGGAPWDDSFHPSVSASGRYVAFESYSYDSQLVTGGANDDYNHVFLRDTCIGVSGPCTPSTVQIDTTPTGDQPKADGEYPSISATGRFVVFQSDSNTIIDGLNNGEGMWNVFVRDTCIGVSSGCTPKTYLVSTNTAGVQANTSSYVTNSDAPSASVSADGSKITFLSLATNLAPGLPPPSYTQAYVRNTCLGVTGPCAPTTQTVEINPTGQAGNGLLYNYPQISGDGTTVVFDSWATNLLSTPVGDYVTVYLAGSGFEPATTIDHFAVSPSTSTPTQAAPFSVTVTAVDAQGNPATTYTGTIHFSLTNPDSGAVIPADYAFVSGDNGTHTFSNFMLTVEGAQSISVNDLVTPTVVGSANVTVQSAPIDHFVVTPSTTTPVQGTTFSVTVTAKDSLGDTITGYSGTVHFSLANPDSGAAVPADYTFVSADMGVHTFNSVILTVSGAQTVKVNDTVSSTAAGSTAVNVQIAVIDHFAVNASTSTPTQGTAFSVTVTAQDAHGDTITGYTGTVHFSITNPDGGATIPKDTAFLAGDNGVRIFSAITLTVQGAQTIQVNDVVTTTAKGSASVTVEHQASADLAVNPGSPGQAPSVTVTNNGPDTATNVVLSDTLDRYAFVSATASQGGPCTFDSITVSCPVGTLAAGASATLTVTVNAPSQGWASQTFAAHSSVQDPVPSNNSVWVSSSPEYNTRAGDNISVSLTDPDGDAATVNFTTVTTGGSTKVSSAGSAITPPAGYRFGAPAIVYDVSTSAAFVGPILLALRFNRATFHHPEKVRIFHMESGFWVDRTAGLNPSAFLISAVTASLSPFIVVEPINHVPAANAGSARSLDGVNAKGASVQLDGSASSDADGDALTYRWTGPFPEGSGTVTGVRPNVTLPLGTSSVTLVVNDGEGDSLPVTTNVSVTDFNVVAASSSATVKHGQSATLDIAISPMYGNFSGEVTLACPTLPAGLTCSFSPATVTPGASGGTTKLTITTSASAAMGSNRTVFAFSLAFLPFGLVLAGRRKRAWQVGIGFILIVVLAASLVSCGGGSQSASVSPSTTPTGATSNIIVSGSAGSLSHSQTITLTVTN